MARRDPRIETIYEDSDGWWIELRPGFIGDNQTHGIHEDTKREALDKLALVVPCDCAECLSLIAKATQKAVR